MSNKVCERTGCEVLLIGRQKTCCSLECKRVWFGESRKKENPIWTKEYEKEYSKQYREKNKEKAIIVNREWRHKNAEHVASEKRKERANLKESVLKHYSNGNMCCANCGFTDIRALQLDHTNNNGAQERKELFGDRTKAGTTFYRWIRKQGYPEGYAILCANCNIIKLREYEKTLWK